LALLCGAAGGPGAVVGTENKSGVVPADRRVDMPQLCRRRLTATMGCRRYAATLFLETIFPKLYPAPSSFALCPVCCCQR
jgi:hypothetical protein